MADLTYENLFGEPPKKAKPRPPKVPREVILLFEKLALEVARAGWDHYSASAVLQRIRWHYHVDIGDRDFKINDHHSPYLARWFELRHPHLEGFFFKRSAAADYTDNAHMLEDADE